MSLLSLVLDLRIKALDSGPHLGELGLEGEHALDPGQVETRGGEVGNQPEPLHVSAAVAPGTAIAALGLEKPFALVDAQCLGVQARSAAKLKIQPLTLSMATAIAAHGCTGHHDNFGDDLAQTSSMFKLWHVLTCRGPLRALVDGSTNPLGLEIVHDVSRDLSMMSRDTTRGGGEGTRTLGLYIANVWFSAF